MSDRSIKSRPSAPNPPAPDRELNERASRHFTWRQLFHVGETFAVLQRAGIAPENVPHDAASWDGYSALAQQLLDPLVEHFGDVRVTYGFASPILTRAIRTRSKLEGRPAQIHPALDQHAASERRGGRLICARQGAAVDVLAPGHLSFAVMQWLRRSRLPFDRLYIYGDGRPLHLSWAPSPHRQVVEMRPGKSGRLIPRVLP